MGSIPIARTTANQIQKCIDKEGRKLEGIIGGLMLRSVVGMAIVLFYIVPMYIWDGKE